MPSSPPPRPPPAAWAPVASTSSRTFSAEHFVSEKTGLQLLLSRCPGPTACAAIVVPTVVQPGDDAGLPHTLEHLCFIGSEDFPHAGVIDRIASVLLADGTNAWTDVDHTAYTATHAGKEGLLQLLPVFLDHILFPLLTDSAYLTEVHHVNGEGADAGVVYCEMQARENTQADLAWRALQHVVARDTPYVAETGGLTPSIRDPAKMNAERVRAFHRHCYDANKLGLVVCGDMEPADVFAALQGMEDKIVRKRAQRGSVAAIPSAKSSVEPSAHADEQFPQPVVPVVPLPGAKLLFSPLSELSSQERIVTVPFPSDDETTGSIICAWHGPSFLDRDAAAAVDMLMLYLCDTAGVSPLQRLFVEELGVCSDVSFHQDTAPQRIFVLSFESVSTDALESILPALEKFLDKFVRNDFVQIGSPAADAVKPASSEKNESASLSASTGQDRLSMMVDSLDSSFGLDIDRMRDVIKRYVLGFISQTEDQRPWVAQRLLVKHFLRACGKTSDGQFYVDPQETLDAVQVVERLERLLSQPPQFWLDVCSQWFAADRNVSAGVVARPSKKLGDAHAAADTERIKQQRIKLEEAGTLSDHAAAVEAANKANTAAVPPELLVPYRIPDVTAVPRFDITLLNALDGEVVGGSDQAASPAVMAISASARARPLSTRDYVSFDVCHTRSEFVHIALLADTFCSGQCLTPAQRLLVPLLLEVLFESRVKDDYTGSSQLMTSAEVICALERDTVSFGAELGFGGKVIASAGHTGSGMGAADRAPDFQSLVSIGILTECKFSAYKRVLEHWLPKLLWDAEIDPARVLVAASRLAQDVPDLLRDGDSVADAVVEGCFDFTTESNAHSWGIFVQSPLWSLISGHSLGEEDNNSHDDDDDDDDASHAAAESDDDVGSSGSEDVSRLRAVCDELQRIRSRIFSPGHLVVQVTANFDKLCEHDEDVLDPWRGMIEHAPVVVCPRGSMRASVDAEFVSRSLPNAQVAAVGIRAVDGAYLSRSIPTGLPHSDPLRPALRLAMSYFNLMDGPWWGSLRGKGLCYGFGVSQSPRELRTLFSLYRAASAVSVASAWSSALETVSKVLEGDEGAWDLTWLQCAAAVEIYTYLVSRSSPQKTAARVLRNRLQDLPAHADLDDLALVRAAVNNPTLLTESTRRFLLPLFGAAEDGSRAESLVGSVVVTAHPEAMEAMRKAFREPSLPFCAPQFGETFDVHHFISPVLPEITALLETAALSE